MFLILKKRYCGFIYILYYYFKYKPNFIIKLIKLYILLHNNMCVYMKHNNKLDMTIF